MKEKVLVSACLLGEKCRYDGKDNRMEKLLEYLKDKEVYPICPEVMGGLSTPRACSEIRNGRVVNTLDEDVSEAFLQGAKQALKIAEQEGIKLAILKSKSPSCGIGQVYDGTFSKKLIVGNGICAQKLYENGIKIINSDSFR